MHVDKIKTEIRMKGRDLIFKNLDVMGIKVYMRIRIISELDNVYPDL